MPLPQVRRCTAFACPQLTHKLLAPISRRGARWSVIIVLLDSVSGRSGPCHCRAGRTRPGSVTACAVSKGALRRWKTGRRPLPLHRRGLRPNLKPARRNRPCVQSLQSELRQSRRHFRRRRLHLRRLRPHPRRRHVRPRPRRSQVRPLPSSPAPSAPVSSAAPTRDIGFEERFGTRWVVWVGGVALALGGVFLVRYTIEQGLIGPRVRIMLGALLALALIAAGEWQRRSEQSSGAAQSAVGKYSGHSDRGRHHRCLCDRLCGLRALRLPAAADRLRSSRRGGVAMPGRRFAARARARRSRHRRRLSGADAGRVRPSRITGRSTSTSPSSTLRLSRWRAIGCGAGSRSPRLCSARCGRCREPTLVSAPSRALGAHVFHAVTGFALVATFLVCGLLYGPPSDPGEIDHVSSLRAVDLSLDRHDPRAGEPARSRSRSRPSSFSPSRLSASPGAPRPRPPPCR